MARASIGSLVVSLGLDAGEYFAGLDKAEYQAKKMAASVDKGFKALGGILSQAALAAAAVGAAFIATAHSVLEAGDEAVKASQKFGVSIEGFQELAYAGKLADVSNEALGVGLKKLGVNMAEMQANTGEAKEAFKVLGISVESSKGQLKSTEEVFLELADKFASMQDGAGKTALAVKLFGKAGADLIPLLNAGADGLKANAEEARKFGIIIGSETAKQMEQFNDNLTRLKEQSKGFATAILSEMLPALIRLQEQMIEGIKIAGSFLGAIRLFGFSTITLDNAAVKVGEYTEQIKKLQAAQEKQAAAGRKGFDKVVAGQIEDLKKKIEFANFMERQAEEKRAAALGVGLPRLPEKPKTVAPKLTDPNAAKEAEAAAKAKEKYLDALAKIELDAAQSLAQRQTSLLEAQRQANLVSDAQYFAERQRIQKTAYDAEIKTLNEQIDRQQALANSQKSNTKEYYDAQEKLAESLAKRNKLEADGALAVQLLGFQQDASAKAYTRSIEELNVQLLELQGNSVEAAKRRFALQTQDQRERFALPGGDPTGQGAKLLNDIQAAVGYQQQFNDAREEQGFITSRLAITEERIQNTQRVGAISEIESLRRTGEARKQAADEMERFVEQMEAAARLSGNKQLVIQAEQARVALEKLRLESELLADKFNDVFRSAAGDALTEFFDKTKTAKEAFDDFQNSVIRGVNRMVAEALSADLGKALGITGNGPGGGLGGIFASVFGGGSKGPEKLPPGVFGPPAPAASASNNISNVIGSTVGSIGTAFSGFFDKFTSFFDFGFATGTRDVPRDMVARLHKGETVVDASNSRGFGMGSYAPTFVFDGPVDLRTRQQVELAAGKGAKRSIERNG